MRKLGVRSFVALLFMVILLVSFGYFFVIPYVLSPRLSHKEIIEQLSPPRLTESDWQRLNIFNDLVIRGNQLEARSLILKDRAQFMWIVDKLLIEGLFLEWRGQLSESEEKFNLARKICSIFKTDLHDNLWEKQLYYYQSLTGKDLLTKLQAETFWRRGSKAYFGKKINDAISSYKAAIKLFNRLQDKKGQADVLCYLAFMLILQSHYEEALPALMVSLSMAQEINYFIREVTVLSLIGSVYLSLNEYPHCQKYFDQALVMAQKRGFLEEEVRLHERMGVIYRHLGEFLEAEKQLLDCIQLSPALGDTECWAFAEKALGLVYHCLGEYEKASTHIQKAVELYQKVDSPVARASNLVNLGSVFLDWGQSDEALDFYWQALEIMEEVENDEDRAIILSNIGMVYYQTGQYLTALKYQKKALKLIASANLPRVESEITLRQADIFQALGQWKEAISRYRQAVKLADKINYQEARVKAHVGLSQLHRSQGNLSIAWNHVQLALQTANKIQAPTLLWQVVFEAGLICKEVDNVKLAAENFERAIEIIEGTRVKVPTDTSRISFFATMQEVYDEKILLEWEKRKAPDLALQYAERCRARTFLDMAGNSFETTHGIFEVPLLTQIQKVIADEVVCVEYKVLKDKLLIWVIDKHRLWTIENPIPSDTLQNLVIKFRTVIGAENKLEFETGILRENEAIFKQTVALGTKLYTHLIEPITARLSQEKVIYIIPDDVLYYVPFAALITSHSGRPRFLIEDYQIAYLPCLTVLKFLTDREHQKSATAEKGILTVGDPTLDLVYAKKEATRIASLFPNSILLTGVEASKETILNCFTESFRYIHLATHARINEKYPFYSSLLLAESPDSEGSAEKLTVREVVNQKFTRTRMVTLSGCETALGPLYRGEGLVGFTRGFICAGVPTIVSTLWKVDDKYSCDLMVDFYKNLGNGQKFLEALRNAQLETIRKLPQNYLIAYPHPNFWASFILTGAYN